MGVAAAAVVTMGAETTKYTQSLDATRSKTKSFFKDLQSQYGRQSTLAKSLKILGGGGAILGIGLAAKEFAAFGEKIKAISQTSGASAGEIAEKFTQSLPIIGHVYDGLKDIAGALTGIDGEIAAINKTASNQDLVTAAIHHVLQSNIETAAAVEEVWRKTYQHMESLFVSEFESKTLAHLHTYEDEIKSASDAIDKGKTDNKDIAADKKSLEDLRKQKSEIQIPGYERVYYGGSPYGGGGSADNQKEIDDAIAKRDKLASQITAITKKIKQQEQNIETDGNEKIYTATATYYADLTELNVKAGLDWFANFSQNSQKQMAAIKKSNAEKKAEEFKHNKEMAASLLQSIETPLETYRRKVLEIQDLWTHRALTNEQMVKAKNAADKELENATAEKKTSAVNVVEARHAFTVPAGQGVIAKQHLEISRKSLTELIKNNQNLEQVKQALIAGGVSLISDLF